LFFRVNTVHDEVVLECVKLWYFDFPVFQVADGTDGFSDDLGTFALDDATETGGEGIGEEDVFLFVTAEEPVEVLVEAGCVCDGDLYGETLRITVSALQPYVGGVDAAG
jgi:hypothetical protein